MDDTPVAMHVTKLNASGVPTADASYYLHANHLDTPRRATNAAGATVWRVYGEELFYGETYVENYGGGPISPINLRLPGQYFDAETGLHYNYHRHYWPHAGRYVQSDPIGLEGGLNTYLYANGNPLRYIDPDGLMGRGGMPSAPGAVSPVYGLRFGGGGASAPESLPQGVVDASAGFGDALSVGATVGVREAMGTNDVVNFCSNEYWGGVAAGVAVHVVGFRSGGELNLGRNWRFAPWGNRTANPYGRWPHYHRRGAPDSTGTTPPGQGIGRHRPLEPSRHDRQWWDRF